MSYYRFGKSTDRSNTDAESKRGLYIKVAVLTALAFVPVILFIYLTIKPPVPISGKTVDKGYFSPYITFETDWFTFRTDKNWEEVKELTTKDQIYTYRQKIGQNPQGLLVVYVGKVEVAGYENFYTRVQPVTVSEGKPLAVDPIEKHCDEAVPKGFVGNSVQVTQGKASFLCWVGGTVFYAVAGQVDGTTVLPMKRTDGSVGNYTITYRNLAFSPSENTFESVLKTFKSK
jgi:hypothetical protein